MRFAVVVEYGESGLAEFLADQDDWRQFIFNTLFQSDKALNRVSARDVNSFVLVYLRRIE
jgi:hypothetical protein